MLADLNDVFEWIITNNKQLTKTYATLRHSERVNLPFAAFCVAMYFKHKTIEI
jgi:hypothetical protein